MGVGAPRPLNGREGVVVITVHSFREVVVGSGQALLRAGGWLINLPFFLPCTSGGGAHKLVFIAAYMCRLRIL